MDGRGNLGWSSKVEEHNERHAQVSGLTESGPFVFRFRLPSCSSCSLT